MKFIWLGHGSMRIESGDTKLLIDPWLTGNPSLADIHHQSAVEGATHILLTHGHFDHIADVLPLAKRLSVPVVGQYDLMGFWEETEDIETIGFNKGGTVSFGDVAVTMVNACHSSSVVVDGMPVYAGAEAGFMIAGEGKTIYFMGDTDVMADMAIFAELHEPDIGIVPIGGHFTMDPPRAGFACRKFFDFKTIIPCHYRTFPLLAQSADDMNVPGAEIVEPQVLTPITL